MWYQIVSKQSKPDNFNHRQRCMHIIHAIKTAGLFCPRNALHTQLDNWLMFINRDRSLLALQSRFSKHIQTSGLAFVTFMTVT
jgi:hypothetical protein